MTDGAAKTLQVDELILYNFLLKIYFGNFKILGVPEFTKKAFNNLTSRDPNKFWTSGQWMTERRGGSDVGN